MGLFQKENLVLKPSIFEDEQFSGVFAFVFFTPRAKQPDLPAYLYLGDREVIQLAVRLFVWLSFFKMERGV